MNFKQVSEKEWALHTIQFDCHGTEPNRDTLMHVTDSGEVVSKVDYTTDPQTYWINTDLVAPESEVNKAIQSLVVSDF